MDHSIVIRLPALPTLLTLLSYLPFLPFTKPSYPAFIKTVRETGRQVGRNYIQTQEW